MPISDNNKTIQENKRLFFQSGKANVTLSQSHLIYYLDDKVNVLPGHFIFLSLIDFLAPASMFQQKNVVLSGSIGGSNFTFSIPDGTYTAIEMASTINNLFTTASLTCVLSYSKINNKFTFTAGSGVAIVLNSSSFLSQFGFTTEQHTGTTTLTSNIVVDLMPIKNIYLKLQNYSVANNLNGQSSKILAKIPIDEGRYGLINYKQHSNIATEVLNPQLDTLEFILEDDNGTEIDFNSVPYSFTIGVVYDSKQVYIPSDISNTEEIDYLKSIYKDETIED